MRVFVTKAVSRFTRREKLPAASLLEAITRAEKGLIDADLGGGIIKQRVARGGKGRSGGYRTLIAYRRADRSIFIFAFAKSALDNIDADQLKTAREVGAELLGMTAAELRTAIFNGEIEELPYETKKDEPAH